MTEQHDAPDREEPTTADEAETESHGAKMLSPVEEAAESESHGLKMGSPVDEPAEEPSE